VHRREEKQVGDKTKGLACLMSYERIAENSLDFRKYEERANLKTFQLEQNKIERSKNFIEQVVPKNIEECDIKEEKILNNKQIKDLMFFLNKIKSKKSNEQKNEKKILSDKLSETYINKKEKITEESEEDKFE